MLLNLHIKNLALIEELEIDFAEGLNIMTGETGAGKSIIIGSIELALGGKVDRGFLREGTEESLVELIFSVSENQAKEIENLFDYLYLIKLHFLSDSIHETLFTDFHQSCDLFGLFDFHIISNEQVH